jgi:myo-inositol-1-phosphate synthase
MNSLEQAMRDNHKAIPPSMVYAYAALKSGIPFANGAPNLTVDVPALMDFAIEKGIAVCGKDFKTGQTLMKTIPGAGIEVAHAGLHGWYSTNILGNRDGEVLDDPDSFKTKEESKLSVLEYILQPEVIRSFTRISRTWCASTTTPHAATIKKVGTTSTSLVVRLQDADPKLTSLSRLDLGRPIRSGLALFPRFGPADRHERCAEWLSFYFKSPMTAPGLYPEHDHLHPAHEVKKHSAAFARRRPHHAPRPRVLRLTLATLLTF